MSDDIQLISDGEGLALIGNPTDVDRFLTSQGLPSRDLDLPRLRDVLGQGAVASRLGSELATRSGRWVKLTKESAHLIDKHGLRESSTTGLRTGVVKGDKGQIRTFVEFVKGRGSGVTNPGFLAGAAGIMAQLAMQQTMNEITDYLARIDEKVGDVLRAQKDAVIARMVAVGLVIQEAMATREIRRRVDEVTWSKVQTAPATIAETQVYALRQLDALVEKLEGKTKIGDLADAVREAESTIREWLAVLARCFQLQDAISVLELDRVLETAPGELDEHRLGLKKVRQDRLELISRHVERLMTRLDAAAEAANSKVLLHPTAAPAVVQSVTRVATAVDEFCGPLGIGTSRPSWEARRWVDAAAELRDKALEIGAESIDAAKRLGNETLDRARAARDKLSSRVPERALPRPEDEDPARA